MKIALSCFSRVRKVEPLIFPMRRKDKLFSNDAEVIYAVNITFSNEFASLNVVKFELKITASQYYDLIIENYLWSRNSLIDQCISDFY